MTEKQEEKLLKEHETMRKVLLAIKETNTSSTVRKYCKNNDVSPEKELSVRLDLCIIDAKKALKGIKSREQ